MLGPCQPKRGGDPISPVEGGDRSQEGEGKPPPPLSGKMGIFFWFRKEGPPKDQDRGGSGMVNKGV